MRSRQAVLLTPSKSIHPSQLLSRQQSAPIHPQTYPFPSCTYKMPLAQPLSFDILANWWGGVPPSSSCSSLLATPSTRSIFIRINTCKTVSKQTSSTSFRINTYEKHRGGGRCFARALRASSEREVSRPSSFLIPQSIVSLSESQYLPALSRKDRFAFPGNLRAVKGLWK